MIMLMLDGFSLMFVVCGFVLCCVNMVSIVEVLMCVVCVSLIVFCIVVVFLSSCCVIVCIGMLLLLVLFV